MKALQKETVQRHFTHIHTHTRIARVSCVIKCFDLPHHWNSSHKLIKQTNQIQWNFQIWANIVPRNRAINWVNVEISTPHSPPPSTSLFLYLTDTESLILTENQSNEFNSCCESKIFNVILIDLYGIIWQKGWIST